MNNDQNNFQPQGFVQNANGFSSEGNSSARVKKIVTIVLGLLILIGILSVAIFIVLPNFTGKANIGGQVTLTYWGLWEDQQTMQSTINGFESQYPNIKINYVRQDIKQYRDRLIARINNGTGPDIYRFHNSWLPMLYSELSPIPGDVTSVSDFNNTYYPVMQRDLEKNGAIYGIPLEVDTLALYINSDMFKNAGLTPPTNWSEFVNDARALTVKDQNNKIVTAGAAMGTYDNITHAPDILSLLFLQNSVNLSDLKGSSDRAQGALNFYTSFATDQNNVWDGTLDPSIIAFEKGNLGMFFGYSWDYFNIKKASPNLNFQIVPVPQLPNQNVTLASYWADGVSSRSQHQKEAFLFLKYLSQKDTVQKLYTEEAKTRAFGEPYARVDLADSLKDNPIVYPFVEQAAYASSSFMVDSTNDNALNQETDAYLENAVNSMDTGVTVQTAFSTLSDGVNQVLQKYGE